MDERKKGAGRGKSASSSSSLHRYISHKSNIILWQWEEGISVCESGYIFAEEQARLSECLILLPEFSQELSMATQKPARTTQAAQNDFLRHRPISVQNRLLS